MTNPTRQQIIEAHKALTSLLRLASSTSTAYAIFNEEIVRAALPPKPQPTMADVEWDDELHYLAEAKHDIHGQVIMLGLDAGGLIEFIIPSLRDYNRDADQPDTLTPTGKRYTLTEVPND